MYPTSESDPSTGPLTGSKPLSPLTIVPTALTTAMRARRVTPSASHVTRGVVVHFDLCVEPHVGDVVELVLVGEIVHQPHAKGLLGLERPAVDQRAQLVLGLAAAVGNRAHQLIELILVERLAHLAMRRGEALLGQRVDRRLVVADVQEVGIGTDPVEGAAEEDLVAGQPREVERRGREQEHLVGRRRQEVLLTAAVFEEGVDRLPAPPEVDDGLAELLRLGPERRFEPALA